MTQQVIDFRELLERVLPLERLQPPDRRRVQQALHAGVLHEVEAAALMAMDRLEDQGDLRRISSSTNGGARVVRYLPRESSQVITLEVAGPVEKEGMVAYPRSALPARAPADVGQVRRLLRLESVGVDPRGEEALSSLHGQLAQACHDLLGDAEVRLFPLPGTTLESVEDLELRWAMEAITRPGELFYCPDLAAARPDAARRGPCSLVLLAVTSSQGAVQGLLEVRIARPMPYRADDLAWVALLADSCGAVLDRAARIEKLVFVDSTTGVYNRNYFELQAANEMARAQRDHESMALCIADIDDFKTFNTDFGYEAGNAVLAQVAQTLRRGVRPFDTVARWGGEEFAVLLTAPVEPQDVVSICERLRSAVERLRFDVEALDRRKHAVSVTISIGVAMFPECGDTPHEMWRCANQALLLAKQPPKNNVVFHRP